MLHAKFYDHRTISSVGKDFEVFNIYWPGGHLGHVTWTIYIFSPPSQGGPISNLALIG